MNKYLMIFCAVFFVLDKANLKAQESYLISKERAIEIAKQKGYFMEKPNWIVTTDSTKGNYWSIKSVLTRKILFGKAVSVKYKIIEIDATNGEIIKKQRYRNIKRRVHTYHLEKIEH